MKHIKVTTKVKPVKAAESSWQAKLDDMVCELKGGEKDKCVA